MMKYSRIAGSKRRIVIIIINKMSIGVEVVGVVVEARRREW